MAHLYTRGVPSIEWIRSVNKFLTSRSKRGNKLSIVNFFLILTLISLKDYEGHLSIQNP